MAYCRAPNAADRAGLSSDPPRVALLPGDAERPIAAEEARAALRLSDLLNLNEATCAGLVASAGNAASVPAALEHAPLVVRAVYLFFDARTLYTIVLHTLLTAAVSDEYSPEFKKMAVDTLKSLSDNAVDLLLAALDHPNEGAQVLFALERERLLTAPEIQVRADVAWLTGRQMPDGQRRTDN